MGALFSCRVMRIYGFTLINSALPREGATYTKKMNTYKNIDEVRDWYHIQLLTTPYNPLAGDGDHLNDVREACVVVVEEEDGGFFAELNPFYGGDSIRDVWIDDLDSVRLISRGISRDASPADESPSGGRCEDAPCCGCCPSAY